MRLAVEADPRILAVYAANFPAAAHPIACGVEDIIDGALGARLSRAELAWRRAAGTVDALVAGPPCQGHSNLNNHTRTDDPKNALYLRVVRAAKVFEPSAVLIENVPNVVNATDSVVERACVELTRLGYSVWEGTVIASDVGVPQLRRRHVLLASASAFRSSRGGSKAAPHQTRTLRWAIGDITVGGSSDPMLRTTRLSRENLNRANWLIRNGQYDLPNRMRPPCHRNNPDHRYKSMYGRLDWDSPAPTITTGFRSPGQGRFLHPSEPRVLTCREAARIQFFPDWYRFEAAGSICRMAEAIGNAVPSKLASFIVDAALGPAEAVER